MPVSSFVSLLSVHSSIMGSMIASLSFLLKSCIQKKSLKEIKIIHQKIISFGLQNHITLCKDLINVLVSCQAYKSAELVLQVVDNPLKIRLWNGLMAAYAKQFMFTETLQLFEKWRDLPRLKPDGYSYPSLLKACGGLGRAEYGKGVHAHLIKTGFLSDVVVASSLFGFYAKCGVFLSAIELFDEIPERDVACWNNVISCYYQSGRPKKALEYFERMKKFGFKPDSVTYTTVISSCGRVLDLERGERIHDEILRSGFMLDGFVSAALLDMYGKCGRLDVAKDIFEGIANKSLVFWNAMIGGYSLQGDSASCIQLLARMNKEKMRPSCTTISTLLVACAKSLQLQHGKFVHGYILRNSVEADIFVNSSLVDLYFKCGSIVLAEKVFHLMPKTNIVAWNVMISGYVLVGHYLEALGIYNDMRRTGIQPDSITLTSALAASSQLAALEQGKELHRRISENNLVSDEVVMGALLDMYAKCGAVEEAQAVFSQLSRRDLVSWTSMIVAYGSHGRPFQALELFDELLRSSTKPDRVTFLAIISTCSHAGLVHRGQYYFSLMVNEYGIQPTIQEYSCLIDLLGRAGRLHEAYKILQNNPSIKEDIDLLSTLFSACNLHKELELGQEIAKLLIEKDPDNPSIYIVLAKMYASNKMWDEARKIRLRIKELGLRKNPGCSWIEVDGKIQSFIAQDKMFPLAEPVHDYLSLLHGDMEMYKMISLQPEAVEVTL